MKYKKIITNILSLFILTSIIFSNISFADSIDIISLNINNPPDKPCNISPDNGSINEPINVTLIVCCSDPDGDTMNISFYNTQGDILIGIHHNVSTGFPGIMEWANLDYNTTYQWYAIANDSELENKSDIWTFKTIQYTGDNRPPNNPVNPSPSSGMTGVVLNPVLSVVVSDPDGDLLDVGFYDASDDILIGVDNDVVSGGVANVTWSDLDLNMTYSWYVIVNDSEYEIISDEWNFTTSETPINSPPNQPINPLPSDGEAGVDIDLVLSVVVSDPDGDSLNVSFFNASDDSLIGVDNDVISGGVASVTWSDLDLNMTYSWYVIVNDSKDENLSDTWFFKTINIKLKIEISGGIGVNALISNIGDDDAINVEWDISIVSKGILGFIDESNEGNIDLIKAKDDIIAKKLLVFGFGFVDITVNADCDWATEVTETSNAILIGFFIILY